jgi:hypothetical protein
MNVQRLGKRARPGQARTRPQASALNISGDRARNLQKQRLAARGIELELQIAPANWSI